MKKLIFIALAILPLMLKAPPVNSYDKQIRAYHNYIEQEKLRKNEQLEKFLFHLSFRESRHDWKIINRFGYMGKYQFGNDALASIGLKHITTSKFRNNNNIFPIHLQDEAVKRLMYRNTDLLKKYMKYIGCNIQGIQITKSGLLAAAHLGGAGNVKRFLDSEGISNFADANGTKISNYLKEFADYAF